MEDAHRQQKVTVLEERKGKKDWQFETDVMYIALLASHDPQQ